MQRYAVISRSGISFKATIGAAGWNNFIFIEYIWQKLEIQNYLASFKNRFVCAKRNRYFEVLYILS